jgi:hypothetical protein
MSMVHHCAPSLHITTWNQQENPNISVIVQSVALAKNMYHKEHSYDINLTERQTQVNSQQISMNISP